MTDKVAAIIVAAGRGVRAGGDLPKQYRQVLGHPVIRTSLAAFADHANIALVQPVINPADAALYRRSVIGLDLLPAVDGGHTRQASVRAGAEALQVHGPALVLVHDAARPFVSEALIDRAIASARASGAAVPVIEVADTLKIIDRAGLVTGTIDRASVRRVQTPQAFDFGTLLEAHRRAQASGRNDFTDDAALLEWAGFNVNTFQGEAANVKLTTEEDFALAVNSKLAALSDVRTGFGFDVHQFAPGDHIMLAGVRIPHERALSGHSDADVVLHALVDALLGALSEGDIGVHFPPSDPQWRGASSSRFLAFAVGRVRARGGLIAQLDVTVVCESPRISPYRDAIRAAIADVAGLPVGRVSVKATTSEKMGFTGRGEGMAAFASATLRLPWSE